jgi:hypothetical protein
MSVNGAGVFRHLLHVIEDDKTFTFEGIPLSVAECGAVCVPLQTSRESPPEGAWPPCHPCDACFPTDPERRTGTAMSASDDDLDQLAAAALAALQRGDEAAAAKLGKIHDKLVQARDEDEK